MTPTELGWRTLDQARRQAWVRYRSRPLLPREPVPFQEPTFTALLPPGTATKVPAGLREELLGAADGLLKGRFEVLGVARADLDEPDWFYDPVSGRRAPEQTYAFRIDYRSEAVAGNVKQVWELSRLQHLGLLSAAFFVSGREVYAEQVARQLRSWWASNPFLSGIHWTSGIELAERLVTWVWVRRLLASWPGAPGLFEKNETARRQVYWHQRYLAAFQARGSSANNHVIAEAVGQFVAGSAFDWFAESGRWRRRAGNLFERELERNTFPSGLDREQASDYHGFVTELALLAVAEGELGGDPFPEPTLERLAAMLDAAAAVLDARGRPPRQGDGDDGRGVLLDPPTVDRWASLLAAGAEIVGRAAWWPEEPPSVMSVLVGGLVKATRQVARRPGPRPSHFGDAGLTILRSGPGGRLPEIWCRCDGGPHGYLSLSAHAHADALSVELRHGGVDVLADPGTYCYHGERAWRGYFRSTLAHNTIELGGEDQSIAGGPFLWLSAARSEVVGVVYDAEGRPVSWEAWHDGYERLRPSALHHRRVDLDDRRREVRITDRVESDAGHRLRMAFHLGEAVQDELDGARAHLSWNTGAGRAEATLDLPGELRWTRHRGETEPVLGWYSPRFGVKEPSTTLVGEGRCGGAARPLETVLTFRP